MSTADRASETAASTEPDQAFTSASPTNAETSSTGEPEIAL
jgi:hypothetical protein